MPPAAVDEARKAELVRLLIDAGERAKTIVSAALQEAGAPGSASDMLWVLATGESPLTLRDIAVRLGKDPSTVSLAADKLQAAGIVERRPHPTDGRKRVVVLTERGAHLWTSLRDRLHDSNLFGGLSAGQQGTLLELLRQTVEPHAGLTRGDDRP
jgi:DNA-binding MarR family transcriptional regulator